VPRPVITAAAAGGGVVLALALLLLHDEFVFASSYSFILAQEFPMHYSCHH
jgi:hypothetical protein